MNMSYILLVDMSNVLVLNGCDFTSDIYNVVLMRGLGNLGLDGMEPDFWAFIYWDRDLRSNVPGQEFEALM